MSNPAKSIPLNEDLRWFIVMLVNRIEGLAKKDLDKMFDETGAFKILLNHPLVSRTKFLLVASYWIRTTEIERRNANSVFSCLLRQRNPQWVSGNLDFRSVGEPPTNYEFKAYVQV